MYKNRNSKNLLSLCFVFIILKNFFAFVILFSILGIDLAFADSELWISVTDTADDIIFDGKWTFKKEWKHSSLDQLENDQGILIIRHSHDRKNIYILLDVLYDEVKSNQSDKAMICFDTMMDGGVTIHNDDYCFVASMGSKNPITLQGGSDIITKANLKKIPNHPELIAVGGFSDENDRYTSTPHATYEFKIPIEILGYSSAYGFYVHVYDNDSRKIFTWPENQTSEKYPFIASPDQWGTIVSPDKSIPEFNLPILMLIPTFFVIILLTMYKRHGLFNQIQ